MNTAAAVERLCHLPRDFRRGDKSAFQLASEVQIDTQSLDAAAIAKVLIAHPDLIDDWFRWSEDQRSSPAYYLVEERGTFVVGRFPGQERMVFSDRIAACADFVLKYVRQLR